VRNLAETGDIVAQAATKQVLGLITEDEQFFLFDANGDAIEQREIRPPHLGAPTMKKLGRFIAE
jgi:hypothetical protein